MKTCEDYQMNVSAMIDGELHSTELTETIAHIAQCQSCMEEFEKFQQMDAKISEEAVPEPVPEAIWERISKGITPARKTISIPLRSRFTKVIGIAAVLAITFTLGYQSRKNVIPLIEANDPIVLASNRGEMNEAQFLSLTRELLTADPVYHKRMYMILHTLIGRGWEGNIESQENMPEERSQHRDILKQVDYDEENETFRF